MISPVAMRFLIPLLTCGLGFPMPIQASQAAPKMDLSKVYGLIVGVLEWEDPTWGKFSKADRQDVKFARTLNAQGVPEDQLAVLLDEDATLDRILAELARIAANATEDSTLIVYYAGHGTRKAGGSFANYDARAKHMLRMEDIAQVLEQNFKGARFFGFADCCHSGSLESVVDRLAGRGISAAAITSAIPESRSTGNWTFTQTLVESFAGDSSHDDDGDGFVEVGELIDAVEDAMVFREGQDAGISIKGTNPDLCLVSAKPVPAESGGSPHSPGDHVMILKGPRAGSIARILHHVPGDQILVRLYSYAAHADIKLPATTLSDRLRLCEVKWKGRWYPAIVLDEPMPRRYQIHYLGYDSSWDEVVGEKRIRFAE